MRPYIEIPSWLTATGHFKILSLTIYGWKQSAGERYSPSAGLKVKYDGSRLDQMDWTPSLYLSLCSPDPSCCHHAADLFPQCRGACEQVTTFTSAKHHSNTDTAFRETSSPELFLLLNQNHCTVCECLCYLQNTEWYYSYRIVWQSQLFLSELRVVNTELLWIYRECSPPSFEVKWWKNSAGESYI